ncbi:MAG: CCA tRNA nucleotidyltransferase [Pseudomonadota bacterium]
MTLQAAWLDDPGAKAVVAALEAAGHQAWFVGGCVRNALMGRADSDIDIATTARPTDTKAAAKSAGLKAVPTGEDHGTITVVARGTGYEVTTLRRDVETDGRHAKVVFSDRLEEDAARRDFTMNALYADARGLVLDPLGGLPDLEAGRVRFIGDADARIPEDYLRILRFFRFSAWYGDPKEGLDADGLAACAAGASGLAQIAAERIGHEIRKLLAAPDPDPAVAAMAQSGVLARVLPGADVNALGPLLHLEEQAQATADPIRRLAVLGGENPTDALRLTRAESHAVTLLSQAARDGADLKRLTVDHGAGRATDVALLRAALLVQPWTSDWADQIELASLAKFPVQAQDLMPDYQGKALGDRLAQLRDAWITSEFSMDRTALLALPDPDEPTT